MNSKLHDSQQCIDVALKNLELVYNHLENANRNLQSPNSKRQISNIKRLVLSLTDQVEKLERNHLESLENIERRKMMVQDERFRTNYNHNTDGRIKGAYYSGPGDMRKRS